MPNTFLATTGTGLSVAAESSGEVWHSADYGDHWQALPFNLGGIHRTLIMM
jgi:hypothetical protein